MEENQKASNHSTLTTDEINYLLEKIELNYKNNNHQDQSQKEFAELLKKQLLKLKGENNTETELNSTPIADTTDHYINQRNHSKIRFKDMLRDKLLEFITLNLATGSKCCQISGMLCQINHDFITLLDKEDILQIKMEAIANIKTQIKSTNNNKYLNNYKSPDNNEYDYLSNEIKTTKKLRSYTEINSNDE